MAVSGARRSGVTIWRKVRQRLRALWRWVVVRAVRGWAQRLSGDRPDRAEDAASYGDVRQFPNGR